MKNGPVRTLHQISLGDPAHLIRSCPSLGPCRRAETVAERASALPHASRASIASIDAAGRRRPCAPTHGAWMRADERGLVLGVPKSVTARAKSVTVLVAASDVFFAYRCQKDLDTFDIEWLS